eukprot:CAMPEP_0194752286 /NCGR_PEP_ID=MMETSP0323_2-20130528/6070_1 /TAXON_ID=2866 ORGANISM="Crypthecodinium cohnii, Strain Seligo" /NCGR_SAMPLE_ID=MMETSP0323_2 /ASSEMBLY_ACC=CAM_ASM_000346 /LENGTH=113 /DNA_ID=CAMNT_0039669077 /DNA_START=417 /DNA_END=759 /DNA_ORIENTATION=+
MAKSASFITGKPQLGAARSQGEQALSESPRPSTLVREASVTTVLLLDEVLLCFEHVDQLPERGHFAIGHKFELAHEEQPVFKAEIECCLSISLLDLGEVMRVGMGEASEDSRM